MQFEAIADDVLDEVSGGVDWNAVGMQTMQGAAAGATVGWATGWGIFPMMIGGAAVGGGLAAYSTWNQSTVKK
jgi:hypothetical protein